MKKSFVYLAIAAALAACHGSGSDSSLQRKDQQQYDVVQEGQASGVTSTINAPGEVAPPPAPMTGTNADTTSNFTLPQVATTGTQPNQPGTLAGTMPQVPNGSMATPGAPPRPRTTTTTITVAPPAPPRHVEPRTDTTGTSVEGPPPATSTIPPNVDTAPPPPPSTDTTSTTKSDQPKKKDNNPPPTQTDTQPPPSTTST